MERLEAFAASGARESNLNPTFRTLGAAVCDESRRQEGVIKIRRQFPLVFTYYQIWQLSPHKDMLHPSAITRRPHNP